MEPEINIWIGRAEDTWLNVLHDHVESLFQKGTLRSHDHTHHRRVWNLCKALMREISRFNSRMDQSLVEGVLIAALFHDVGMASSIREDHGRLSRERCEQWFRETGRDLPERYGEILRAIELHDRKDDQIYGAFDPDSTPEILAILSVADDLEALGTIGIYRYAEIYVRRGIPAEDLGTRILNNAEIRFEKLAQACSLCPRLLEKYRKEYDVLNDFYERYNRQLKDKGNTDRVKTGPLGVINYIRRQNFNPTDRDGAGKGPGEYFKKLEYELEQARL